MRTVAGMRFHMRKGITARVGLKYQSTQRRLWVRPLLTVLNPWQLIAHCVFTRSAITRPLKMLPSPKPAGQAQPGHRGGCRQGTRGGAKARPHQRTKQRNAAW